LALLEHVRARARRHDAKEVVIRTAPGGLDRHVHCALYDAHGCGETSPGPDGHVHRVQGGRVIPTADHTHDFSGVRCDHQHDADVQHGPLRGLVDFIAWAAGGR
jgi:hypothetical protein